MPRPKVEEIRLGGPIEPWEALGLEADGARIDIGGLRLRFTGAEPGIHGWALRGLATTDVDGLDTSRAEDDDLLPAGAPEHPLGAVAIDHVVIATTSLDRAGEALAQAGLPLRRTREIDGGGGRTVRQGFVRAGAAVVELVEPPAAVGLAGDGPPARFWGLVVVVRDIDEAVARLGDLAGAPRDAVQPGRRIATVRGDAGLGTAVALITPEPES